MRSASLLSSRPRSEAFILGHGPSSKALRAALTARSTSALSPSATWQMVSPVAGLTVGNVLPETLSCHLPPMNSGWSLTRGGLTVRAFDGVAVAMMSSGKGEGYATLGRSRGRDCRTGGEPCQENEELKKIRSRMAKVVAAFF